MSTAGPPGIHRLKPDKPDRPIEPGAAFRRFKDTMRALLAVPKKEIDEQAANWKRRKDKNKKSSPGHIVNNGARRSSDVKAP